MRVNATSTRLPSCACLSFRLGSSPLLFALNILNEAKLLLWPLLREDMRVHTTLQPAQETPCALASLLMAAEPLKILPATVAQCH